MTAHPYDKPVGTVSFAKIYAAIEASAADLYHLDVVRGAAAPWPQTLGEAVQQYAPLAGGGVMPLQALLKHLCVPATMGRAERMLEMVRSQGMDWQTAFANSHEDKQAATGGGKRTRAYERVKKARQRLLEGQDTDPIASDGQQVVLTSQLVADLQLAQMLLEDAGYRDEASRLSEFFRGVA